MLLIDPIKGLPKTGRMVGRQAQMMPRQGSTNASMAASASSPSMELEERWGEVKGMERETGCVQVRSTSVVLS